MAQIIQPKKKKDTGEKVLEVVGTVGKLGSFIPGGVGLAAGAAGQAAGVGEQALEGERQKETPQVQSSGQAGAMNRRLGAQTDNKLATLKEGILALPDAPKDVRTQVGPQLLDAYQQGLAEMQQQQRRQRGFA